MAFFNKLFGKNTNPEPTVPKQVDTSTSKSASISQADKPLPYDSWLAFRDASKENIVRALGMTDIHMCTWEEGIRASTAPESLLFVTAPINGCNIVMGSALPELAYRTRAVSWITNLGAYIPKVYAFAVQENVQVYAFAQVEEQTLYRIYAAAQGSVRINKGERTDAEEALKFNFPSTDDELFEPNGLTVPCAQTIRELAAYWSIDPAQAIGAKGLLGKVEKI